MVDSVEDNPVLYGRLINFNNGLCYTATSSVAYHTNYDFPNMTLNDYGTSEESEQLHLTAKLDSALDTEELLRNLWGDILGELPGLLLTPLLNTITHVLDTTTFAWDVKLPELSIQSIVAGDLFFRKWQLIFDEQRRNPPLCFRKRGFFRCLLSAAREGWLKQMVSSSHYYIALKPTSKLQID